MLRHPSGSWALVLESCFVAKHLFRLAPAPVGRNCPKVACVFECPFAIKPGPCVLANIKADGCGKGFCGAGATTSGADLSSMLNPVGTILEGPARSARTRTLDCLRR